MTSFLVITLSLLTSCDNDHYGPAPVDVTANYSNKLSNPNPNLILTYNGETMIGKSVDFCTVTGETAIVTLYDILPGEKELKMVSIPLSGDEEGYSFSGKDIGKNLQTGRFSVSLPPCQKEANYIQEINTTGNTTFLY